MPGVDSEEDFSLEDDSEEEESDAFSANEATDASSEENGDDFELEDESDFEDAKPKAKATKKTPGRTPKTPAAKKSATPTTVSKKTTVKSKATAVPKPKTALKDVTNTSAISKAHVTPPVKLGGNPESQVYEYMRKTNRPYSMLNVFENLHRVIPKPNLTRILDALTDKGELVAKTYGKSKIYYMNQNNLPVPDEAERQEVEASINSEEDTCVKLEKQLKALESELSGINSQISDADLDNLLTELQDEEQNLQQKLSILEKPGRKPISPGKKDTLKRKFNTYRAEWIKRRRIVLDAVNQIADGMEKKPKDVYGMCCIETDEEVGVKQIPSI